MIDMDYLNIDNMYICQLLLLRYNDENLQAGGSFIKLIINKGIIQRKFIFQFY